VQDVLVSYKYVAIGDSTVEGIEDPGPGGVYVGWADRLANHLAAVHPGLRYANLAVRGQTSAQVLHTQLDPALALAPDLAVVVAGVNDLLRPRFDADVLHENLRTMHAALSEGGAQVITFTMPDMARVAPMAVVLRGRLAALNRVTRELADEQGSIVVDLAAEPMASDPALWHDDRLHANSEGHRRIALALAEGLGVDAGEWRDLRATEPERRGVAQVAGLLATEAAWFAGHVLPWAWGHLRGRNEREERVCKRPDLLPLS
jgi:lysophospholipase L1-like esterase